MLLQEEFAQQIHTTRYPAFFNFVVPASVSPMKGRRYVGKPRPVATYLAPGLIGMAGWCPGRYGLPSSSTYPSFWLAQEFVVKIWWGYKKNSINMASYLFWRGDGQGWVCQVSAKDLTTKSCSHLSRPQNSIRNSHWTNESWVLEGHRFKYFLLTQTFGGTWVGGSTLSPVM